MADPKSPEDLENLAKTLEVELDPTSPSLQSGPDQVAVNPALDGEQTKNVPSAPQAPAPASDEISLEDLFGAGAGVATTDSAAPQVQQVEVAPVTSEPQPSVEKPKDTKPVKGLGRALSRIKGVASTVAKRSYDWSTTAYTFVKRGVGGLQEVSKKGSKKVGVWSLDLWVKIKSVSGWTRQRKLLLLALVLTVATIIAMLSKSKFLKHGPEKSLMDLADQVVVLPEKFEEVQFLSGEAGFDDVLLLKKIVVNVKRSEDSSPNPMVAYECYLQNSNQEVAVEIKDRELEIRDAISRLTEEFSYNDLNTIDGKNRFKLIMRRELNSRLNRGRVVGVYFKTFILKP
jgi:flagellar basal body-associated protein FliL